MMRKLKSLQRYEYICRLLPEYLRALDVSSNFSLRYAIDRLNDLVHDFRIGLPDQRRRDKILNDRLRALRQTQKILGEAIGALNEAGEDYELIGEFEAQLEAFYKVDHEIDIHALNTINSRLAKFVNLLDTLKLVSEAIEITILDISSSHPRRRQINYNMTKSDVVSLAYDLSKTCGGPKMVTTPGSQFSFLCSLIYEMATGEVGQSLAGAIIQFSNSRERQEADENEDENSNDEAAYESNDNFYSQRVAVRRAIETSDWYRSAADNSGLRVPTKLALLRRAALSLEEANERQKRHGPFIVWADHAPHADREAWHREFEESQEELREARILLGESRRALRNLG